MQDPRTIPGIDIEMAGAMLKSRELQPGPPLDVTVASVRRVSDEQPVQIDLVETETPGAGFRIRLPHPGDGPGDRSFCLRMKRQILQYVFDFLPFAGGFGPTRAMPIPRLSCTLIA